jgi:hypothetical protein
MNSEERYRKEKADIKKMNEGEEVDEEDERKRM